MILFKDKTELKPYFPFNVNTELSVLEPYLERAGEEFISRFIGKDQYNDILAQYIAEPGTPLDQEDIDLVHQIRKPLVNYAALLAVPFLQVNVGAGGVTRRKTQTDDAAFSWTIEDLKLSASDMANQGIENLLEFLHTNIANYPIYAADPLYSSRLKLFVSSAAVFNQHYNISNEFRTFQAMLPIMARIEKQFIESLLGSTFYDELKTELAADSVSANNQKVIENIQPAVCQLTISKAITQLSVKIDERGITVHEGTDKKSFKKVPAQAAYLDQLKRETWQDGQHFLQNLKDFMDANANDYASYKASSSYNEDGFEPRFDNEEGQSFYMV